MTMIGHTTTFKRESLRDERTGRELWKISPDGSNCVAAYMYINSFSEDEKYFFFMSDRTGEWEAYRYTIAASETVQLTDFRNDKNNINLLNSNINLASNELFSWNGSEIHAIHLESLSRRIVTDFSGLDDFQCITGCLRFSGDGRYCISPYIRRDERYGIARFDTEKGEIQSVYIRPEEQMQHLNYIPGEYDLVSYSQAPDHQQEWDADDMTRARTYLLNVESGKLSPIIVTPPPCTATHEYWGPTGDRLYYHKKTRPDWLPTWLCVIDRHTMETREIFRTDEYMLGHSYVDRSESFIITDVQNANNNPLIRVDIESGESEILCWPDSSVKDPHLSHVHPGISPLGTYASFTTDRSGECQAYLVPLAD
jgi:hypothetical protein